jgi:hypothetical protein
MRRTATIRTSSTKREIVHIKSITRLVKTRESSKSYKIKKSQSSILNSLKEVKLAQEHKNAQDSRILER